MITSLKFRGHTHSQVLAPPSESKLLILPKELFSSSVFLLTKIQLGEVGGKRGSKGAMLLLKEVAITFLTHFFCGEQRTRVPAAAKTERCQKRNAISTT